MVAHRVTNRAYLTVEITTAETAQEMARSIPEQYECLGLTFTPSMLTETVGDASRTPLSPSCEQHDAGDPEPCRHRQTTHSQQSQQARELVPLRLQFSVASQP